MHRAGKQRVACDSSEQLSCLLRICAPLAPRHLAARAKLASLGAPTPSFSPLSCRVFAPCPCVLHHLVLVVFPANGLGRQNALCSLQERDTESGCVRASLSCTFVPKSGSAHSGVVCTLLVNCAVYALVFCLSVTATMVHGPFRCRPKTFSVRPSGGPSAGCGSTLTPFTFRLAVRSPHRAVACGTQGFTTSRARHSASTKSYTDRNWSSTTRLYAKRQTKKGKDVCRRGRVRQHGWYMGVGCHRPGVFVQPLCILTACLLPCYSIQVKEGTENRGAIESVIRIVRKAVCASTEFMPEPLVHFPIST